MCMLRPALSRCARRQVVSTRCVGHRLPLPAAAHRNGARGAGHAIHLRCGQPLPCCRDWLRWVDRPGRGRDRRPRERRTVANPSRRRRARCAAQPVAGRRRLMDSILPLARRIAPWGWHLQLLMAPDMLASLGDVLRGVPVPLVFRPPGSRCTRAGRKASCPRTVATAGQGPGLGQALGRLVVSATVVDDPAWRMATSTLRIWRRRSAAYGRRRQRHRQRWPAPLARRRIADRHPSTLVRSSRCRCAAPRTGHQPRRTLRLCAGIDSSTPIPVIEADQALFLPSLHLFQQDVSP